MIKDTPDSTYSFHVQLEYNYEHGLRFHFIDEDGSIVCTKFSLSELLKAISLRVNSVIFSSLHAF